MRSCSPRAVATIALWKSAPMAIRKYGLYGLTLRNNYVKLVRIVKGNALKQADDFKLVANPTDRASC